MTSYGERGTVLYCSERELVLWLRREVERNSCGAVREEREW